MLFKDLKPGNTVYLFNNKTVELKLSKVSDVSLPHIDKSYSTMQEMVVDIIIDGKLYTFKENSDTGYTSDLIITLSKDIILREIEAIKSLGELMLSLIDLIKENVEKCSTLLAEFNPVYKEKLETDRRLSRLETSLDELKNLLQSALSKSTTILS